MSAIFAIASHGQMDVAGSSNAPKAETVDDAAGNLHVPDAYRTTYQSLGSWAVGADHGMGSKEPHLVYASPGTVAAYKETAMFLTAQCL